MVRTLRKLETKPSLLTWVSAAPGRAFTAFILLHAIVWTALPTLLFLNLPLDLIEALVYGREWQIGYDKLPPLPWWMVEILYRLIGHDFAYYLLAQIVIIAAFTLVFIMARSLVGTLGALISVILLDGLHYFNFTAAKFNHDVIQLPFWALAGFSFHRALRTNRISHWVLLGLAVGISLWAKYFVLVLAVPMILFVILDREARRNLKTPGPYIALAVAVIIMAPHLIWLVKNDFLPLAYAEHRAVLPRGWYDHLWHPLQFAASQLFFLIPSFLIIAPLLLPPHTATEPAILSRADDYDKRIITWLAFGPIVTVLAMAAISGRGAVAMWGYPLWLFLGLWIIVTARITFTLRRFAKVLTIWAAVVVCFALTFVVDYSVLHYIDHRYRAMFFPGNDIAREISKRYQKITGRLPKYVIANIWDGGNISHYATSQPRLLIDGEPWRAPWIDLSDLRREGAVVVWTWGFPDEYPDQYRKIAPAAAIQPPLYLPYRNGQMISHVGWAILPPIPEPASAPKVQP